MAPAGLRKEQTCVKEMLDGGQIEPSDNPWVSPVALVTKKDGTTRFCVDYHRLNALTTKDAYPLPRIDDSLRLLGNQQWFSTMYLASGYWQVAMSPEAKRNAAFVTNEGLFQFRVMPFGLCNVREADGSCFVRDALVPLFGVFRRRDLVWWNCYGGPWAPRRGTVPSQQLRPATQGQDMYLHAVVFLGHIVGRTGLACDPAKLAVVRNWHAPDKVKGVRQFVGFVGYYR